VIEVADRVAVCEGGSGALGHPIQYIQLDRVNPAPAVCKYCGLRYKMAKRYNRFGKEKKFDAH
jgi:NADH dehydrogenase (ubiquinone) Fe-S protein 6